MARERQEAQGLQSLGEAAEQAGQGVEETITGPGRQVQRALEGDRQALLSLAAEIGLSIVGGGVGGRLASRLTGMTGGARVLAGRTAGGGAGGAVGAELFAPEGETTSESARRRAVDFAEGSGGEIAASVLGRVTGPVGRATVAVLRRVPGLRRAVDPLRAGSRGMLERGAEEVQEILARRGAAERAGSFTMGGPTLTAGQMVDSPLLDTVERAVKGSFLGGGIIRSQERRAVQTVLDEVDDIASRFLEGAGRAESGEALRVALTDAADLHREAVRTAFAEADRLVGNPMVSTESLKRAAGRFADRARLPGNSTIRENLRFIQALPDRIGFEEASLIRSHLGDIGFSGAEEIPRVVQGFGRALRKEIGNEMDSAVKAIDSSGEAASALTRARDLSRIGKERFNESFIGPLLRRSTPEQVFEGAIQAQRPTKVREVRSIIFDPQNREAVGDPQEFWRRVQGQWMQDFLSRVESTPTGEVSGASMINFLRRQGGEFLQELFPNGEADRLGRSAAALMRAQEGPGQGATPFMFIQAGALVALGFRDEEIGVSSPSTWIILSPIALASALTRPGVAEFLARGATGEGAGRGAAKLVGQLGLRLASENVPFSVRKPDGTVIDGSTGNPVGSDEEPPPIQPRARPQEAPRPDAGVLGTGGRP